MKKLIHSKDGSVAVSGALFFVVLCAVVSLVIGVAGATSHKHELQMAVDAAALATAREMALGVSSETHLNAIAANYVDANWTGEKATTKAIINPSDRTVKVSASALTQSFAFMQSDTEQTISASAIAEVSGGGNICIVSLEPNFTAAIDLQNGARITAENCQVYSNSAHRYSVSIQNSAKVFMDFICMVGGLRGDPNKFGGTVITDCPAVNDPLKGRPLPEFDANDCYNNSLTGTRINRNSPIRKLKPGVYCGGISINGAKVTFEPGEYIIRGGFLNVSGGGTLIAENVGFVLTDGASIQFLKDSNIEMTAPETGAMAGLLFYETAEILNVVGSDSGLLNGVVGSVTNEILGRHNIRSDNARILVGTIYLPYGNLLIDGSEPVADESEYTVIVANTFELKNGPNLVLRTDYDLSDIPVPNGVGHQDITVRLKH